MPGTVCSATAGDAVLLWLIVTIYIHLSAQCVCITVLVGIEADAAGFAEAVAGFFAEE